MFAGASQNVVGGNYIGADATGAGPLGNGGAGIAIAWTAQNNQIGGVGLLASTLPNTIAFNGLAGVWVVSDSTTGDNTTGNSIRDNSIHDNIGLGIDLGGDYDLNTLSPVPGPDGVTLNDSEGHSAPDNPNNFQNFPVLTSASSSNSSTSICGTFNETAEPFTTITLDFTPTPALGISLPMVIIMVKGRLIWVPPQSRQMPAAARRSTPHFPSATWQDSGSRPRPPIRRETPPSSPDHCCSQRLSQLASALRIRRSSANPVTFTATVAATTPAAGTPTGSVEFIDTTTSVVLGTVPLTNGSAFLTTSSFTIGANSITALYSGGSNFAGAYGVIFQSSSGGLTQTVLPSILVLDPHAGGALSLSGNAKITENGPVIVDSNSATALQASGNAQLTASSIRVVGGVQKSGTAAFHPTPVTGSPALADPLAGLAAPAGGTVQGSEDLAGSSSATINPGIYTQIIVSGNANLVLNPGVYIIAGGGFSISLNATVHGNGVLIYNAGSAFPNAGGKFGSINLSGNSLVALIAPTSGIYAGIGVMQSRDNANAMTLSGYAEFGPDGTVYLPSAALNMSGNSNLSAPLIVDEFALSGNADPSPSLPPRVNSETVAATIAVKRPMVVFSFDSFGNASPHSQSLVNLGDNDSISQATNSRFEIESMRASPQPKLLGLSEELLFALRSAANRLDEAPAVDAVFDTLFSASVDF